MSIYTQPVILGSEHGVTFYRDYDVPEKLKKMLRDTPHKVIMWKRSFYERSIFCGASRAVVCTPLHAKLFLPPTD